MRCAMARVVLSFERNSQLGVTSGGDNDGILVAHGDAGDGGRCEATGSGCGGQALFFDETAARHCGSCHALVHKGTAVGPDLTRPAHLYARAIVTAIRATRTPYVLNVKLKDGTEFPGCRERKRNPAPSTTT